MFLTRSKTSSALNHEQHRNRNKDNMFTPIPNEMISVLQDAVPSIKLALKPVLSETAHELVVEMISTWITTSRITTNNFNSTTNKPKPVTLRSWASRSFSIKSNPVVPQKTEISDTKLCRTPSFTNSESSTSSFSITSVVDKNDMSPSLYTPLLLDTASAPTTAMVEKYVSSRLPVSLKSMIDLLDTPPLIPADAKSLSLIEEALTPLTSTFFHDNDHIEPPLIDSPASVIAASYTTASENNDESIITGISSKDSKSVRRSFSTIFTQLGHSVKKVFKKKPGSSSRLKKTMSVQHNLQQHASPMSIVSKYIWYY